MKLPRQLLPPKGELPKRGYALICVKCHTPVICVFQPQPDGWKPVYVNADSWIAHPSMVYNRHHKPHGRRCPSFNPVIKKAKETITSEE